MPELSQNRALTPRNQEAESLPLLIDISERNDVGMIDLRGKADDKAFLKNAAAALGIELPLTPRTSAKKGKITILWLSVDQWLITAPLKKVDKLQQDLDNKLKKNLCLVCNVSDARTIIRLTGDQVREVLIKGCSTDLTLAEFSPGTVRRLLFAEVAALGHFVSSTPDMVDLYVFRSYADYVWKWLLQTAHEDAGIGLFQVQDAPVV